MSNPAPPLSDAEKLLQVCRAVWPERVSDPDDDPDELGSFMVELGLSRTHWYPETDCLDDLRRVLLALTPGQRAAVDNHLWTMLGHGDDRAHPCDILTAPLPTLLDALHKAVVKQ